MCGEEIKEMTRLELSRSFRVAAENTEFRAWDFSVWSRPTALQVLQCHTLLARDFTNHPHQFMYNTYAKREYLHLEYQLNISVYNLKDWEVF